MLVAWYMQTEMPQLPSLPAPCSVDENVSHEIEEESNETFKVKLKAGIIGTAEVSIMWAGRAIPQTPFKVNICDASKCTLSGGPHAWVAKKRGPRDMKKWT